MRDAFFFRFSDPPFNFATLSRRIKSSPLWSLRQTRQQKHISLEPLLLDAVYSCKHLHRVQAASSTNSPSHSGPANRKGLQIYNGFSVPARHAGNTGSGPAKPGRDPEHGSLVTTVASSSSPEMHDLRQALKRAGFPAAGTRDGQPLDLLQRVLERNVSVLSGRVLHAYMTAAPAPPTAHVVALLRQYKSNPWAPSPAEDGVRTRAWLQRFVPPALRSGNGAEPGVEKAPQQHVGLVELCWVAVRMAVYRQEFGRAFEIVDIATTAGQHGGAVFAGLTAPALTEDTPQITYSYETGDGATKRIEFPDVKPASAVDTSSPVPESSPSVLQVDPIAQSKALRAATFRNSATTQVCAASTFSFLSTLATSLYFAYTPPVLQHAAALPVFSPTSSVALAAAVSLVPSLIYASVPALCAQRVRWTPAAIWQHIFPRAVSSTWAVRGLAGICIRAATSLARALGTVFSRVYGTGHAPAVLTNDEMTGLTALDRKLLELRMVDYIAIAYDELADVTVENYHLFGGGDTNERDEAIGMNSLNSMPYLHYNPDDTHARAANAAQSETETGPSAAQPGAQTLLQAQLVQRRLRVKETEHERWFNEYWSFSGEGYVWVEPDQDPSTSMLKRLRYHPQSEKSKS